MARGNIDEDDVYHETTPLLPTSSVPPAPRSFRWTIPLIYMMILVVSIGEYMQAAPRLQIMESIICRDFLSREHGYRGSLADAGIDPRCKLPPVQKELAFIRGIEQLMDAIPTVMAIPFGILANKWGRNRVTTLALVGGTLSEIWVVLVCWFSDILPLRLIWAQFLFEFIGGGSSVIITMLFVITADVTTPEERTNVMFRIRASTMFATILAPSLSSLLMGFNVWLPWLIGESFLFMTLLLSLFLPDTRQPALVSSELPALPSTKHDTSTVRGKISAQLADLASFSRVITSNTQVILIIVLAFLSRLGNDAYIRMLLIYISERYSWTYARANYLQSLGATVQLVALLLLFPVTAHLLLTRGGFSAHAKDRWLTLVSSIAHAIGMYILAFAPVIAIATVGIVVACFGSGSSMLVRSLVSVVVTPEEISVVYSVMSVVEQIGGALAGIIYSSLYSKGLQMGVTWYGLPFFVSGILFTVMLCLVLALKEKVRDAPTPATDALYDEIDGAGEEEAIIRDEETLIRVN